MKTNALVKDAASDFVWLSVVVLVTFEWEQFSEFLSSYNKNWGLLIMKIMVVYNEDKTAYVTLEFT